MHLIKYLPAILLALNFSCAQKSSLTITKKYPPRGQDCGLDVFIDEKDIKRPYETICIIDTKTGKSSFHKKGLDKVIDIARPLACSAGADGLLLMRTGRFDGHGFNEAGGSSIGVFKGFKYTDNGPRPEKIEREPQTQIEKANAAYKKRKAAKNGKN